MTRLFLLSHIIICTLLLLIAMHLQITLHLAPCYLCMKARYIYVAVIITALFALRFPSHSTFFTSLLVALYVLNFSVALFHTGIEQHWWQGFSSCSSAITGNSIEALRAALATAPIVRCDAIAWTLGGLSMATYNIGISFMLLVSFFYKK